MITRNQDMISDVAANEIAVATEVARLKQRVLFLEGELMQFAHVISHDLQEPLRKIQIYSGILRERESIGADAEVVDKILTSSNRMSVLVADVMAYAKVVRDGKMLRPVDLHDVATKVLHDFEIAIAERGAIITLDRLPVVSAIGLEMYQLFYNLVDNALKFSKPDGIPEIGICCKKLTPAVAAKYISNPQQGKTYYDISIRDNGIGFNVNYADKIFKVFGRLHPKGVYSGTGIGLSLCRIIMENHEGTLFAESQPGEGSAFHLIIAE